MARVYNPLFALAASGSVANITYQQHSADNAAPHQARKKPHARTDPPSFAQADRRARFAAAALAWATLDTITRESWREAGYNRVKFGRQAFIAEYIIQQCKAPDLPLRPAPNYLVPAP
jgi:hypothetical protein